MLGVLLIILLMIGGSLLAGAKEMIEEAFSDPNWLSFDEPMNEKERLEMENTEWSWGHNIKNYMEDRK